MHTLEQEIRSFITDNFLLAEDAADLDAGTSLTHSGVIDSVGVVELMHFLETRFGIEITDDETVPDNIDSIDNMVRYVRGKLAYTAGPLRAESTEHVDARA